MGCAASLNADGTIVQEHREILMRIILQRALYDLTDQRQNFIISDVDNSRSLHTILTRFLYDLQQLKHYRTSLDRQSLDGQSKSTIDVLIMLAQAAQSEGFRSNATKSTTSSLGHLIEYLRRHTEAHTNYFREDNR